MNTNAVAGLRLLAPFIFVVGLLASTIGARAVDDPVPVPTATAAPDFGNPPVAEIPILYNDHNVYAVPDVLRHARVLAALVKDHQVYIPFRSMLEQMGATVSISPDGKTISAVKDGASVSVTLGVYAAVINGETRPLDVPPILYHGILLAPVRVLSEALGAYVLWVPERRLVVVRYIPATPEPLPPTPAPTPEPTATPTPMPIVVPIPTPYPGFVQAAMVAPKNYNEFSNGVYCPESYLFSAAYPFANSGFAVRVNYRQDAYVTADTRTDAYGNQYTDFNTIDGGRAEVPVFLAKQYTLDGRLEYRIAKPQIYAGVGYLTVANNFGYPKLSAFGVGLEKLPDLRPGFSLYGSAYYYPSASGNYTVGGPSPNAGKTYKQEYQITTYDVGLALVFKRFPVYIYGGFAADQWDAKQNAPIGQTHNGPYLGLGVKL